MYSLEKTTQHDLWINCRKICQYSEHAAYALNKLIFDDLQFAWTNVNNQFLLLANRSIRRDRKKGCSICIKAIAVIRTHFHLFSWTLKLNPEQIGNKISVKIDRVQLLTGSCGSIAKHINSILDKKWKLISNLFQNKFIKCFRYFHCGPFV